MNAQCATLLRLSMVFLTITPLISGKVLAAGGDTAVAEYLLSQPSDNSWSLDAMVSSSRHAIPASEPARVNDKHEGTEKHNRALKQHPSDADRNSLEAKIGRLATQHKVDQQTISGLTAELRSANQSVNFQGVTAPQVAHLKADLRDSQDRADALSNQVSTLNAGLKDREKQLQNMQHPDTELKKNLAAKISALETMQHNIATLQGALAEKDALVATLRRQAKSEELNSLKDRPQNTDSKNDQKKIDILTAELGKKETQLSDIRSQFTKNSQSERLAALERELLRRQQNGESLKRENDELSASLKQVKSGAILVNEKLALRENELSQVSKELDDVRLKMKQQSTPDLNTSLERQSYMAGVMMSDGLADRLTSWKEAGVAVKDGLFSAGLSDGMHKTVRLNEAAGREAKNAFTQSVQNAATARVTAAQKKMQDLAKGRTPLKSGNGIVWYRLRKGRVVPTDQPVTLSMTEQVVGGILLSRIPALTLNDNDDMPIIVQDGLRLPGDGGEVVAYAMAKSVYGTLPLPPGVRPWTVMEYHLCGGKPAG